MERIADRLSAAGSVRAVASLRPFGTASRADGRVQWLQGRGGEGGVGGQGAGGRVTRICLPLRLCKDTERATAHASDGCVGETESPTPCARRVQGQLLGFAECPPAEPCEMSWNAAAKRAAFASADSAEAAFYDQSEEGRNEQDAEQVFIYERVAPPPAV